MFGEGGKSRVGNVGCQRQIREFQIGSGRTQGMPNEHEDMAMVGRIYEKFLQTKEL